MSTSTATLAAPAREISLWATRCSTQIGFKVTFSNDQQAVDWVESHSSGFAMEPYDYETDAWDDFPGLISLLYPTCDHGLSLALCAGPGHYPADDRYI